MVKWDCSHDHVVDGHLYLLVLVVEMDKEMPDDVLKDPAPQVQLLAAQEDQNRLGDFYPDPILGVVEALQEHWVEILQFIILCKLVGVER